MLRHSLRRVAALRRRRTLAHLASKGPGFLGCLGHGDWKDSNELEAIRDDNDNFVRVTSVGAGWAHSAAVLEDGVCVVWGRYLEPPESALRLSHIERVVPPLARLVNATASLLDRDGSLRLRPTPITDDMSQGSLWCGCYCIDKNKWILGDAGREPVRPVRRRRPFGRRAGTYTREMGLYTSTHLHRSIGLPPRPLSLREWSSLSWGKNDAGQLGDGTRNSRPAVAPVSLDEACMAIGAGLNHSAALTTDGRLFVWGKMRDSPHQKNLLLFRAIYRTCMATLCHLNKYQATATRPWLVAPSTAWR